MSFLDIMLSHRHPSNLLNAAGSFVPISSWICHGMPSKTRCNSALLYGMVFNRAQVFKNFELFFQCILMACLIFQIESMIFCFIQKHQGISKTLQKFTMPNSLVGLLITVFALYTFAVVCLYYRNCLAQNENMAYLKKVSPLMDV